MKHARKISGLVAVLALSALPAHGADPTPTPVEVHTLTPMDSVPTKEEIAANVSGPDKLARLQELIVDPTVDFGIQLRAIRAVPHFCGSPCSGTPRDVILQVIASVPAADRSGRGILRLRAGIESLGVARTGQDADVDLLVPYLDHASRDIRATTARALRDMCNTRAIDPLRKRYQREQIDQVRLAISAALRVLDQCSQ
ncbi:MAG TPA: HEAT repeat domain-containing protein [Kofleriaceae bacterium]|nr:HEAT repeat domain-containing protein [Kofleriaceae bacterium]